MLDFDEQSHQLPGELDLGDRVEAAGYNFSFVGENIFAFAESAFHCHAALAIDWGFDAGGIQDPPGHRINIMSIDFRELGIGIIEGTGMGTNDPHVGPLSITQDFGDRQNFGDPWLLGVVFKDLDGDGFYSEGEGIAGVNVSIDGAGMFETNTMSAGGYQIQLPAGMYDVTFSGGDIVAPVVTSVTISNDNVKLDLDLAALPSADLLVTKTDGPDPVIVGGDVTYTIVVTNRGPDAATDLVLADALPGSVVFVSASPGCTNAGGVITCGLVGLASGASTSIVIVVTTTVEGTITNQVGVAGKEGDPDLANNAAEAITTVNPVPPPVVTCALAPPTATNLINTAHGVTSTVTSNAMPVAGVTVDFEVVSGPNLGETGSEATDGSGEATFQYTGDGGVGTDIIQATGMVGGQAFTCTATKVWFDIVVGCDLSPSTDTNLLDTVHIVTANVTIDGVATPGVLVDFEVVAGPNTGDSGMDTTDANGNATFQYTGDGGAGTDFIRATGTFGGHSFTCTAAKVWVPLSAVCSLAPVADTNQVGTAHSVVSTVLTNNNPATGVTVHFEVVSGPNAGATASTLTDGGGQATFMYNSNGTPGTDALMATGIVSGVSFSCSATKVWVQGPCADLSGTWGKVKSKCKVKDDVETCKLSGSLAVPNTGDAGAGETVVRYFLSDDNVLDGGDTQIGEGLVKALTVGKSGKGKLKATLIDNSPVGRFLLAVIDAGGAVSECNENNNVTAFGPLP